MIRNLAEKTARYILRGEIVQLTTDRDRFKHAAQLRMPGSRKPEIGPGAIYVDLDGTLAHHEKWVAPEVIGEPIPAMMERVKQWVAEGKIVKIFTARYMEHHGFVRAWLKSHGLGQIEVTSIKGIDAYEFWDDRAVPVEMNTGRIMDVRRIYGLTETSEEQRAAAMESEDPLLYNAIANCNKYLEENKALRGQLEAANQHVKILEETVEDRAEVDRQIREVLWLNHEGSTIDAVKLLWGNLQKAQAELADLKVTDKQIRIMLGMLETGSTVDEIRARLGEQAATEKARAELQAKVMETARANGEIAKLLADAWNQVYELGYVPKVHEANTETPQRAIDDELALIPDISSALYRQIQANAELAVRARVEAPLLAEIAECQAEVSRIRGIADNFCVERNNVMAERDTLKARAEKQELEMDKVLTREADTHADLLSRVEAMKAERDTIRAERNGLQKRNDIQAGQLKHIDGEISPLMSEVASLKQELASVRQSPEACKCRSFPHDLATGLDMVFGDGHHPMCTESLRKPTTDQKAGA